MDEQKTKILIVEDDASIAKLLVNKLNESGFLAFHEDNGESGLQKATQEKPDIILLDLMMPVMDGMTMLKALREDEWGKNAKVIIMTNLTNDSKLEEAFKYGVYEYLVKANWNLDDVVDKIKHSLED